MTTRVRQDAQRALRCLYIAVDEDVAKDVQKKVSAALNEVDAAIERVLDVVKEMENQTLPAVRFYYSARIRNAINGRPL